MACTKTSSSNHEIRFLPRARPHPQPPNSTNDQSFDHYPLNETPLHTVLPNKIIPLSEPSKPLPSKHRSSKKPNVNPKPNATRRSQRMRKGSSSKPTTSHVDLVFDGEKEEKSSDEMEEAYEEEVLSNKGEEDVLE